MMMVATADDDVVSIRTLRFQIDTLTIRLTSFRMAVNIFLTVQKSS